MTQPKQLIDLPDDEFKMAVDTILFSLSDASEKMNTKIAQLQDAIGGAETRLNREIKAIKMENNSMKEVQNRLMALLTEKAEKHE